jgi:hypothetical protein
MALLPDLTSAALYAGVLFLLVLGVLVVFAESIGRKRLGVLLAINAAAVLILIGIGEAGLGILAAAFGLAFVIHEFFERLSSR